MKNILRTAGLVASVLALALMSTFIQPAYTAQASGYEAFPKWEMAQPHEPVLVYSSDPCISPGLDYEWEGVYATFHPNDNSGDIDAGLIGRYDENGDWDYGYLEIPDVPAGDYEVTLTCRESDQNTVTMTYDSFMFEVATNSISYLAPETNWLSDATIYSGTPCGWSALRLTTIRTRLFWVSLNTLRWVTPIVPVQVRTIPTFWVQRHASSLRIVTPFM